MKYHNAKQNNYSSVICQQLVLEGGAAASEEGTWICWFEGD